MSVKSQVYTLHFTQQPTLGVVVFEENQFSGSDSFYVVWGVHLPYHLTLVQIKNRSTKNVQTIKVGGGANFDLKI